MEEIPHPEKKTLKKPISTKYQWIYSCIPLCNFFIIGFIYIRNANVLKKVFLFALCFLVTGLLAAGLWFIMTDLISLINGDIVRKIFYFTGAYFLTIFTCLSLVVFQKILFKI